LTGVNVGDYGRRIGTDLVSLLRELEKVEGLARIRISSIEPNLLTDDIIRLARDSEKICHHFHIPLQSGSNEILRLMRRRYQTALYRDLIYTIKEEMPDAGIGADVIVGFPGETEKHFEETYRFLVELPVSYIHVFTYSERPNTYAAQLPGAVDSRVRAQRSEMLRNLSSRKRRYFYERFLGRTVSVLMEGTVENDLRIGHTRHYVRVGVPSVAAKENAIVEVLINKVDEDLCVGEVISNLGGRDEVLETMIAGVEV